MPPLSHDRKGRTRVSTAPTTNKVERFGPLVRIIVSGPSYGWINAYVDNQQGTLLIASDWGDWTHRWGLAGMPPGKSVDQFLFARSEGHWDYVANKLLRGENNEYDHEATQSAVRKRLAEAFREEHGGKDADRYKKEEYRDAIYGVECAETFDELCEHDAINAFYMVGYEDIGYCASQAYRDLTERILPHLARAWQDATYPAAAVE